jgi:hypothetical protein
MKRFGLVLVASLALAVPSTASAHPVMRRIDAYSAVAAYVKRVEGYHKTRDWPPLRHAYAICHVSSYWPNPWCRISMQFARCGCKHPDGLEWLCSSDLIPLGHYGRRGFRIHDPFLDVDTFVLHSNAF